MLTILNKRILIGSPMFQNFGLQIRFDESSGGSSWNHWIPPMKLQHPMALLECPVLSFTRLDDVHANGLHRQVHPEGDRDFWAAPCSFVFIHTLLLAMWLGGQIFFHTLSPQTKLSSSRMPNISPLLTPNQIQSRKPCVFIAGIHGR